MMLNKSNILTYRTCPKLFKYLYIDRRPRTPNEAMVRGLTVHKFAELFFDKVKIDGSKIEFNLSDITLPLDLKTQKYIENFIDFYS